MKCLIVDDSKMARTVLKHQIKNIDFLDLVGECEDALEATNFMNKEKIDLLLLDVQMPKISGLEFLKSIPNRPLVILITSRPEFAVEAFEFNVVDYILKPVKEERFIKAVLRVKEIHDSLSGTIKADKEYFFFKEKGVASKLKISDILYIQAMGDYINIHTMDKKYTIHYTLSAIAKELSPDKFMRIHRSYIVALDRIDTVEDGTTYICQSHIPVSDMHRSTLMGRLNLL
jgi:two-component system, LytTR family, response regulator